MKVCADFPLENASFSSYRKALLPMSSVLEKLFSNILCEKEAECMMYQSELEASKKLKKTISPPRYILVVLVYQV